MRKSAWRVLFIGDGNLGEEGLRLVRARFGDARAILCTCRSDPAAEARARAVIRSGDWDICFSFYSDLILDDEDLERIRIPLNIHPASPCLPGVGYDTLPLVEDHATFGVTLHRMVRQVDAGPIINCIEEAVPPGIPYSRFRPLTQQLSLRMMERTARDLSAPRTLDQLRGLLEERCSLLNLQWNARYVSRKRLAVILDRLRKEDPGHRVFK